jgi:hypothetical protein
MRAMKTFRLLPALLLVACGGAPAPVAGPAEVPRPVAVASDVRVAEGTLAPMPVAVTSFGAAAHDGYAYVLGGYHGTPHDYRPEGQSRELARVPLDGTGGWERVDTLEAGLQGLALVATSEGLCRIGGNRVVAPSELRSLDEVACFDPATGRWAPLPPLPEARSSHMAAVVDDTVFVAGGWTLGEAGPSEASWSSTLLLRAPGEDGWRSVEAPFQRRAVGVAAVGGRLAVLGGLTPEREVSRRLDWFDPATGAWSRGPDFPEDAFGVAAVGVGDVLYASGRGGGLFRLPAGAEAWERAGDLAFPRFFHQLLPVEGGLVALGGIGGMHTSGRTRIVERIAFEGGTRVATFDLPYPGRAKNRQGVLVRGDDVYLFGGNDSLGQHDFEPENFLSDGWRFHVPSLSFEEAAAFPARRQTMQTVSDDASGLAVGGFGHDGEAAVTHPDAFVFDFEAATWSPRGGLPRGRTQFGLVTHGTRTWIFGGLNYDPAREGAAAFEHETTILAAEGEGAFEAIDVALPGPRRAFAGARLGGTYYLVGGMREGFELVDDCLAFDFERRDFRPIACPSRLRLSGHLIPVGDRLALVGGTVRGDDGMESDRSVEVYDPATDRWSRAVERLPFEMRHAHVLPWNGRILILSTHNDEGRLRMALVHLVDA